MKKLISIIFLIPIFPSCASPSKSELDAEVRRLCAIDGGINIYETVKMTRKKFIQWGQINFIDPLRWRMRWVQIIYKSEEHPYREGNLSMARYRHQVLRKSDRKLLGETTSHVRGAEIFLVRGSHLTTITRRLQKVRKSHYSIISSQWRKNKWSAYLNI